MLSPEEFLEQYLEPQTLPEFMGKVVDSTFTTDARVNNGNTMMLVWTVETSTRNQEVRWNCGDVNQGWRSVDGGKTVENSQGKKFHGNSAMIRLLTSVGQLGLGQEVNDAGGAFKSATWLGTTWQFGSEEVNFGGEIGKRPVRILTEYLGGFGGTVDPTSTSSSSPEKFDAVLGKLDGAQREAIRVAAGNGVNLADWAITNLPGLMSDGEFRAALHEDGFREAACLI